MSQLTVALGPAGLKPAAQELPRTVASTVKENSRRRTSCGAKRQQVRNDVGCFVGIGTGSHWEVQDQIRRSRDWRHRINTRSRRFVESDDATAALLHPRPIFLMRKHHAIGRGRRFANFGEHRRTVRGRQAVEFNFSPCFVFDLVCVECTT